MARSSEVDKFFTDDNLDDLETTAWYGGINYWASADEHAAITMHEPFHILDREDDGDLDGCTVHTITRAALVNAFVDIVNGDVPLAQYIRDYFHHAWDQRTPDDGIEMGEIDSDAADVWVQVALFGKVVYG